MKKKLCIAAACAGALLAAPFAHAQAALADVDKQIREAWSKVNSFSGVVKIDGMVAFAANGAAPNPKAPKLPLTGSGNILYQKDGDKAKYRQTIDAKLLSMVAGVDAVFDGEKLRLKTNLQGTQKVQDAEPSIDKGLVPPGGGPLLDEIQKHIELTPKADAQLNGRPVFVLEGKLKPGEKMVLPVSSVNISIDKEIGALSQLEFIGSDASSKITLAVNDIKLNPEIKPDAFAPPVATAPKPAAGAPAAGAAPAPAAAPAQ